MAKVRCLAGVSMLCFAASSKMASERGKVLVDDANPLISVAFFGAAGDQWGQSFKLRTHGAVHTCITPTSSHQVILSDCDKTDRAQCFRYKKGTKMLKAFGLGSSSDTAGDWDCLHAEEKGTAPTLDLLSCDSCGAEDCKFVPSIPDTLGYFTLSALGGKLEAGTGSLSFVDNDATGTSVRFYSDYEEDCGDDGPKVPGSSGEANFADTPIAHQAVGKHAHAQAERMMNAADAAAAPPGSMMAELDAAVAEVSSVSAMTKEKKTQAMLGESADDMVAAADDAAAQEVIGNSSDHHARSRAEDAAQEVTGEIMDHAQTDHAHAQGNRSELETLANLALARQHKKAEPLA